jgi:biopolymer transport protein ExbB/TolQ
MENIVIIGLIVAVVIVLMMAILSRLIERRVRAMEGKMNDQDIYEELKL